MDMIGEYWHSSQLPKIPTLHADPLRLAEIPSAIWAMFRRPTIIGPRLVSTPIWVPVVLVVGSLYLSKHLALPALPTQWIIGEGLTRVFGYYLDVALTHVGFGELASPISAFSIWVVVIAICALLLWSFVSHGDGFKISYMRACKLLLWSIVYWVPVALLFFGLKLLVHKYEPNIASSFVGRLVDNIYFNSWGLIGLGGLLFILNMIFRLSAIRPADETRKGIEARCISCRYQLTGLPIDGRCPECNTPIQESIPVLPGGNTLTIRAVLKGMLRPKKFLLERPLLGSPTAAYRIAWRALLISGIMTAIVGIILNLLLGSRPMIDIVEVVLASTTSGIQIMFQTLMFVGFAAFFAGIFVRGNALPRAHAIAYALCWVMPITVILCISHSFLWCAHHLHIISSRITVSWMNSVVVLVLIVAFLVQLVRSIRAVRRVL